MSVNTGEVINTECSSDGKYSRVDCSLELSVKRFQEIPLKIDKKNFIWTLDTSAESIALNIILQNLLRQYHIFKTYQKY